MPLPLFLSHDHRDARIAEVIASTLARISLRQVAVWFSSDKSRTGGIMPGNIWLDEIRRRLTESRAVLPLLTPHSISKPWLVFEAGFGAAQPSSEVIPITLGIDAMDSIPFPLAMYQCFQLADYDSFKTLCSRLLARYDIAFDEEMAAPVLRAAIREFSRHSWEGATVAEKKPDLLTMRDDIKEHIDRRLYDFFQRQAALEPPDDKERRSGFMPYTVQVILKFPKHEAVQYLEIHEDTNIDSITNNIFFLLDGEVEPYTYLKDWILRHPRSNRLLVVREFGGFIAASQIFRPGDVWEALPLTKPYTWKDSADIDRWT